MEANNMKEMRKALEFADRELRAATESDRYGDDLVYLVGCMREVASACRAALAKPPRNCDIGTADDQGERFSAYCRTHKHPESECLPCPLLGQTGGHCELAWAQMLCEEGGAK